MPEITDFLKGKKKKSTSSSDDWNMTSILSTPKPTTPQRRPGRVDLEESVIEVVSDSGLDKEVTTNPPQTYNKTSNKVTTNPPQTYNKTSNSSNQ
jgi:hypothetical protein